MKRGGNMPRAFLVIAASFVMATGVFGQLDPGNCDLAGSTLQFCDPAGVACTTSAGKPGTCTQRPNGCQCVPTGNSDRPPSRVDICHLAENSGKYVPITVSIKALAAHRGHHDDCLVDDGNRCTSDRCHRILGCVHEPDNSGCDDGIFCNGIETCTPTGACMTVSSCPPVAGCLVGSCDEEHDRCVSTPDHAQCDDEDDCTIDRCDDDGDCFSEPSCRSDEDCAADPCLVASCNDDGCCEAVDRCPQTPPGCVTMTGECSEDTGECVEEEAPFGTRCDTATGSTLCGENGCDGTCQPDGCIQTLCGNGVDDPDEECEIGQTCLPANQPCNPNCTCPLATCFDGVQNGSESAVDCGGPDCPCCDFGRHCNATGDCCAGVSCVNDICNPQLPVGSGCATALFCATGFCVDGFCCDRECFGTCIACSRALTGLATDGLCGPATLGTDPHNDCVEPVTCNGAGACGAP